MRILLSPQSLRGSTTMPLLIQSSRTSMRMHLELCHGRTSGYPEFCSESCSCPERALDHPPELCLLLGCASGLPPTLYLCCGQPPGCLPELCFLCGSALDCSSGPFVLDCFCVSGFMSLSVFGFFFLVFDFCPPPLIPPT